MSPGVVCVVGSAVMDLIAYTNTRPAVGETVVGTSYSIAPGGKGFNQAIAAKRAGANVRFAGAVGRDDFGIQLTKAMAVEGIDVRWLRVSRSQPTGAGFPVVTPSGDNSITVVPGASSLADGDGIDFLGAALDGVEIVAIQMELPATVADFVASEARSRGVRVMLNPAPATSVTQSLLSLADFLVPNELEAEMLTGESDPGRAAVGLAGAHEGLRVVVTCGAAGAVVAENGRPTWVEASQFGPVVDTVGAGDVFCGYLAASVARDVPFLEAVRLSVSAASLSVAEPGGALSAPYYDVAAVANLQQGYRLE